MKDQIYEPLERSADVAVKVVVMSKRFLDGVILGMGEIHSVTGNLYKNPVICTHNIANVFNRYYDMLLSITKSRALKYQDKAARYLTLSFFYGYFCNIHMENEPSRRSGKYEIFSRFLELLQMYHKQERQIMFYAGKLCMTPKYLSRIIKDVTGHSALEYIEDYVITEAKSLLASTNMSIQEISYELGFPSQSVFGKYFKRVTRMSPKEYRNSFMNNLP